MKKKNLSTSEQGYFCQHWPQTKATLKFIRKNSPNFAVRIACMIIIGIGNTAAEEFCK